MPFDPTKPVRTRDGRPARIICTDRKGSPTGMNRDYPIIALYAAADGEENVRAYTKHGYAWAYPPAGYEGQDDLVNVERHTVEVEIYRNDNTGEVYVSKKGEFGHHRAGCNRLLATTTVQVTFPALKSAEQ